MKLSERRKEFSKKIKLICNSTNRMNLSPKQAIEDVIGHVCLLLMNKQFITGVFPRTLYQYSSSFVPRLKHYKEEPEAHEIMKELCQDFIALIKCSEPFSDTVGMLYDEYLGQVLGQFLTPPDVAYTLAAISLVGADFSQERSIADPCGCGAGSLLLGTLRCIYETHGKEAVANVHIEAVDLDINMVRMTTVQIVMHSILHQIPLASFKVHHANTISEYQEILTNQKVGFWWIPNSPMEMYMNIIGNEEMDKALKILEVFSEVTAKIKNTQPIKEVETV